MSRTCCPSCTLPSERCYCEFVHDVISPVEVIIWQHPSEARHPKGTAALLHRCLTNSQLIRTEQLDQGSFEAATGQTSRSLRLLFPDDTATENHTNQPPQEPDQVRLLVLDGTWRKARKLMHINPWLHTVVRLPLTSLPASHYSIRKAEKPGQLSTLEATCTALAQLEQNSLTSQPILDAFTSYMRKLSQFRPHH